MPELAKRKLRIIADRYNLTPEEMNIPNMLDRAIAAEEIIKRSEPNSFDYDIARMRFVDFENAAYYLEIIRPFIKETRNAL